MKTLLFLASLALALPCWADPSVVAKSLTASGATNPAITESQLSSVGRTVAQLELSGTWVGSLHVQGTLDSAPSSTSTWTRLPLNSQTGAPMGLTATVNGYYRVCVDGYQAVRVSATAISSGTVVTTLGVGLGSCARPRPAGTPLSTTLAAGSTYELIPAQLTKSIHVLSVQASASAATTYSMQGGSARGTTLTVVSGYLAANGVTTPQVDRVLPVGVSLSATVAGGILDVCLEYEYVP